MDPKEFVGQDETKPKPELYVKSRPTLFIGLGGTGMEVMLRVRRRILNATWGKREPVRLNSLAEFPVAQFLHIDLDQGAVLDSGKAQTTDPLVELVKLPAEDRIAQTFDLQKYSRSDDDLAKFPHVEAWSPMTPKKIRDLGIDPSKGAGQIRAISRLYFFDKYAAIRDSIRNKLASLKSGLNHKEQLDRLELEHEPTKFRIVVIASIAGGTGSGSFLDLGWLARWLASKSPMEADVQLMLFLPAGYQAYNKDRTEANGYAALMELEPCMMGNTGYVSKWAPGELPDLARTPYSDIYLVDSGNLANQHTKEIKDVYDMVADALFEDFSSAEFATRKRSVAVNQQQFKINPYHPPVPENKYGDMKLKYFKGYSAFGHSVLDTQQSLRQDEREFRWAAAMLKSFFGLGALDKEAHQANDKQRDAFLIDHLKLGMNQFDDFPEFSAKVDLKLSSSSFQDWQITDDLLTDPQGAVQAGLQQKVNQRLEEIGSSSEKESWPKMVRDSLRLFERDAIRDQDTVANTSEDRIGQRRAVLLEKMSISLQDRLFDYLDNKEYGGLQYVLSLVELIKDRFDNAELGISAALELNARRYQEIRDALKTHEIERLLKNLEEACGKGFLGIGGGKVEQARKILEQLKQEIGNYLKFHVRYVAANEAAGMLSDLSKRLGEKVGVGADGQPRWTGIVEVFQAGREAVLDMNAEIEKLIARLNEDAKKEHATYMFISAKERQISLPDQAQLREWADEAFKDFGGSKTIFPMLKDAKERDRLLRALRGKASRELIVSARDDLPDPLVEALAALSPQERRRRFSEFLMRAMPWIEGHFGDVVVTADQFKCFIGVSRVADWKQFEEELKSQVPVSAGISANQIQLLDTGIDGRAACYCELSGVPLTVLAGLEAWRTSYRQEAEKIPLHTHKDPTQFVHPQAPTTSELAERADDLKLFLLAVMLRVLTRESRTTVPPGLYVFDFGRGDRRSLGNERAFRLNGLPSTSRNQILAAVNDRKDELDGTQIAALSVLALHYAQQVYAPRNERRETGEQYPMRGFASAMALSLSRELEEQASRKGIGVADLSKITLKLEEWDDPQTINRWTEIISDSNQDAYPWEVAEHVDGEPVRLKRRVRKEFFESGWLQKLLTNGAAEPVPSGIASSATPPPILPGTVPVGLSYYYQLNGQQLGPMPFQIIQQLVVAKVLNGAVMAWREGMPAWLPLAQIPECAALFGPPQVTSGAGGPPPLP
ncbi:MAG: tubulin-like doman-containing protein [Betaproteobacteria bacterium]